MVLWSLLSPDTLSLLPEHSLIFKWNNTQVYDSPKFMSQPYPFGALFLIFLQKSLLYEIIEWWAPLVPSNTVQHRIPKVLTYLKAHEKSRPEDNYRELLVEHYCYCYYKAVPWWHYCSGPSVNLVGQGVHHSSHHRPSGSLHWGLILCQNGLSRQSLTQFPGAVEVERDNRCVQWAESSRLASPLPLRKKWYQLPTKRWTLPYL